MDKTLLSVIIITKNEQDNVEACLESVKWADEIIVVDSGSTDKQKKFVENIQTNFILKTGLDLAFKNKER